MSTAEQWRTFAREAETNAFDYQHGTVMVSARSIANLWQTVARMSEQLARQVDQAEALRRIRPEPSTPVAELPNDAAPGTIGAFVQHAGLAGDAYTQQQAASRGAQAATGSAKSVKGKR